MQSPYPIEDLLQRFALVLLAQIIDNFIKVLALHGSGTRIKSLEGNRNGFQQPENFLDSLAVAPFKKKSFRLLRDRWIVS